MVLKKILLLISPLFFISCSLLEPGLSVLKGNYSYQQGNYQNSLLSYLDRKDEGSHSERILYNIGTVYYALGEGPSALDLWKDSALSTDEEVLFSSSFNSGVVYYQSGLFTEAYQSFRRSLELKPGSLEAKKNLELTLERLEAESGSGENRSSGSMQDVSDDARRIMQYIKRKEGSQWKQQESTPSSEQDW